MDAPRPSLYGLEPDALPMPDGAPPFRREQLAGWLYERGAADWEAMTNLPARWRAELGARYRLSPFDAVRRFPSRDGSVRYLFTLPDGRQTEAVYMPYKGRRTLCVSSMVGCPAGCAFCATGALGFGRNLDRSEIVGQITAVAEQEGIAPREIRNVVLMGMGEALLNYDHAVGAIRTLIHPRGLAMSPRRITLSTVGLPARIRRLAGEDLPLVLALSLHAPDEATRRQIIPTAHAHPIPEILGALHDWQAATGRRVSIEYTMLDGVNDAPGQARALASLLEGLHTHVNLIPFNPWPGSGFRASPRRTIDAFRQRLEAAGLAVSVRFSRGRDTGGACGQLALQGASSPPATEPGRGAA